MSLSSLCDCCCRRRRSRNDNLVNGASQDGAIGGRACDEHVEHVRLSVQTPISHRASSLLANETPGQTAHRLRGELNTMTQQKENEQTSQRQTMAASSQLHQHQMDDMKSGHATEMAEMKQNNSDNTTACNATMAAMNVSTQQQMARHMADHKSSMMVMRNGNDGVEVKCNERVNVLKLANAQRMTNLEQRLDAQCTDLKQKQRTDELMHSQRMKVLSFSHVGVASDARNRNAIDMEAQRTDTKNKRRCQQNKVDAANERHHQSIDTEEVRHGQEMCDMKTTSDAKTAEHDTKMVRIGDKNKHKTDDVNHMALHFVSLESKLKQSEARCAVHEQTLVDHAQTILQSQSRQDLLVAQSEVVRAVKEAIEKDRVKQAASGKRRKFGSYEEESAFMRNEIECAIAANNVFDEEVTAFLAMLAELNEQIRKTC